MIAIALVSLALAASPAPEEWFEVGSAHSSVGFTVPFMGLTRVRGQFDGVAGAIRYDAARPERSSVSVEIDVASLHTGNASRDRHLLSADFLDAGRFPHIVFHSTALRRTRSGFAVSGDLTLHGQTRKVELPLADVSRGVKDLSGVRYLAFEGRLPLRWKDFGIAGTGARNPWFKPAEMTIGEELTVELVIQASRRDLRVVRYPRLTAALEAITKVGAEAWIASQRSRDGGVPDLAMLIDAAAALADAGKPEDAARLAAFAVELYPEDPDAWAKRAELGRRQGQSREAVEHARKALALDRDHPLAFELLEEHQE